MRRARTRALSRLLIIGSPTFTVGAMQFALRLGGDYSVLAVAGGGAGLAEEVRQARPDIVVLDGVTDGARVHEGMSEIRAAAQGTLLLVVVNDVDAIPTLRALDTEAVICAWPVAVRKPIRTERRGGGRVQHLRIAGGSEVAPQLVPAEARRVPPEPQLVPAEARRVPPEPQRVPAEPQRVPPALTSREIETLGWVAEGHTNAWIARRLWVTERTVKFHLTNIYRKLGVANRTEASHYAIRHGLLSDLSGDSIPLGVAPPIDEAAVADAPAVHA